VLGSKAFPANQSVHQVTSPPALNPSLSRYSVSVQARSRIEKMWHQIRAAHSAGKIKRRNHLISRFIGSYDVRLAATRLALAKLKPHRRPNKKQLAATAFSLNARQGTAEEVRVSLRPKPHAEDYRVTMDFGIEHRALQYIVHDVLRAIADLHPRQYANRGGVQPAIRHVVKAMTEGYLSGVEIDLENCFQSFDADKVPDHSPLPKKVTESVLLSRSLNLVPGNLRQLFGPAGEEFVNETLAAARRGIPQGSAASPRLAEMLLAWSLRQLPTASEFVAYADNILILGKSENEVASMTLALWTALKAHPAGPLRPNFPKWFKAGTPILFLGHALTPTKAGIKIEPSPENLAEFNCELTRGLAAIGRHPIPISNRLRRADHLKRWVRGWAAAFSLCPDVKARRESWLAEINSAAAQAKAYMKSNPKTKHANN
jgi:hypothetical protein